MVAVMSRARLGVRHRYRNDARLDSRYPKIDRVAVDRKLVIVNKPLKFKISKVELD